MLESVLHHLIEESPAIAALAMLVLVIMAGTAAQVLAERLRLPATGPLLITGLMLGPAGLALVQGDAGEHVAEVVVAAEEAVGRTLEELAVPGCAVVAIRRGDQVLTPQGSTRLQEGDTVTLLGDKRSVTRATACLNPNT